jgi:hypothetical protein
MIHETDSATGQGEAVKLLFRNCCLLVCKKFSSVNFTRLARKKKLNKKLFESTAKSVNHPADVA